jgi:hypothetical protein
MRKDAPCSICYRAQKGIAPPERSATIAFELLLLIPVVIGLVTLARWIRGRSKGSKSYAAMK